MLALVYLHDYAYDTSLPPLSGRHSRHYGIDRPFVIRQVPDLEDTDTLWSQENNPGQRPANGSVRRT